MGHSHGRVCFSFVAGKGIGNIILKKKVTLAFLGHYSDAARCSLTWIVISNWTPSCPALRAEALSSTAAAANTSASVEEHTDVPDHFSPRRSTICSPAWVQHNGPYLQPIPRENGTANVLPCATSHTCSGAAHGVHNSADQRAAYHRMLLQQHCRVFSSLPPTLPSYVASSCSSIAQDRQIQLN